MAFMQMEFIGLPAYSNMTLDPTEPNYQLDGIRRYNFGAGHSYDQNMIERTHHGYQSKYRSHFVDQYGRIVNKPPPDDSRYRPHLTAAVVEAPAAVVEATAAVVVAPSRRPRRKHRNRSDRRQRNDRRKRNDEDYDDIEYPDDSSDRESDHA